MAARRSKYFREQDKDKGYAWVCAFSAFCLATLETGNLSMQGVFFVPIISYFAVSKAATAVIGCLCVGMSGLSGVILGLFVTRYGVRPVVIFGSLVSGFGLAVSYAAPNIVFLDIFMGVFAGIGNGCYVMGYLMGVMNYFEKRMSIAFGIQTLGYSAGALIFPPVAEAAIQAYSWRGALLIMSGFQLNGIICGALLRPTEAEAENKPNTEEEDVKNRQDQIKSCLYEMFDPSLLKDPRLLIHFICISLVCAGDLIPIIFLPVRGVSIGESEAKAALLVTIYGVTAGFARIGFGILGDIIKTYKIIGMAVAAISCGVLMIISYPFHLYYQLVIFSAIFGILSGAYTVFFLAILGDLSPKDKMPQATGIAMVIFGAGALTAPPVGGAIVDVLGTYSSAFAVFGVVMIVGGILTCATFVLQVRYLKTHAHEVADEVAVDSKPESEDRISLAEVKT